jgi:hypothetical protein
VADDRIFQVWGVIDQVLQLHEIHEEINDYKRYHPRASELQGTVKKSLGVGLGKRLGLVG